MCGIAGIINKTPRKFDYSAFCTLGIINDSRGGDSCGVFIDGKYEYGVKDSKLFSDYFQNSDLLTETTTSTIALLHCRKASVGNISEKTAQPVIIGDKSGNIKYVLIHNGTIHNYRQLADKYIKDCDIKDLTDSQVMALIFYYNGYSALSEYVGSGAFAIVDYRKEIPTILLFKGSSKKNRFSDGAEEERPLYYCIDDKNKELVFSSISAPLMALRKENKTFSIKPNTLFSFNGESLVPVATYDRKECFQSVSSGYTGYQMYYSLGSNYDNEDYTNYVAIDIENNTYSDRGGKLHGKKCITSYGRVCKEGTQQSKIMWFFLGIPLMSEACFNYLTELAKDLKISNATLIKERESLVRYLSVDKVFKSNNLFLKAIAPFETIPYTGTFRPLYSVSSLEYKNGEKVSHTYTRNHRSIQEIESCMKKSEINLKKVRKECKLLMK